jgi:hypothetical protein
LARYRQALFPASGIVRKVMVAGAKVSVPAIVFAPVSDEDRLASSGARV